MRIRDYKKFEPTPEKDMTYANGENTICELLRETYWMTTDEKIRLNLRIASTMAKRMGDKLHLYKKEEKMESIMKLTNKQRRKTLTNKEKRLLRARTNAGISNKAKRRAMRGA